MADLFIIAAGNGSRMGGSIPKALVPITDEPNVTTTLKQAAGKFVQIFIVINRNVEDKWEEWKAELEEELCKNLRLIPIISGLGDGHAVMEGLRMSQTFCPSEDVVICWGDTFFQHSETFDEILNFVKPSVCLLPVQFEVNPYVVIETNGRVVTGASFSKLGERKESGLHDQSIFRFNRIALNNCLSELDRAFKRNGTYMCPNGELSLLYTFHYLYNANWSVHYYHTKYPTLSFNTVEEVKQIQQEINEKWKSQS